jgi:hypothetical protein
MDRATASPPYFPYREHRNMAQVMADEAAIDCTVCGQTRATRCTYSGCPLSSREAA